MTRPSRPHLPGFSVVEVLIAAAVAALAVGLTLHLFGQSRHSVGETEQKMSTLHQARLILETLKRDLRNAVLDPARSETEMSFDNNGIGLSRLAPGSMSAGDTVRVTWAFDLDRRTVSRTSAGEGTKTWGSGSAKVWFMKIERETAGGAASGRAAFRYTLRLADATNSPRSRIELVGRLFPPALQGHGKVRWNR